MTRSLWVASWFALVVSGVPTVGAAGGAFDFPRAADGRYVVAVDLHTHSVFSDGSVWPAERVAEAERDNLALLAITEHAEWQPHRNDIPHRDRNRAYEIAAAAAGDKLVVVNGVEITRGMPPGHFCAVFVQDANAFIDSEAPVTQTSDELYRLTAGKEQPARRALQAAAQQGAFVIWNHPYYPGHPDGVARWSDMHQALLNDRLFHAIEVANGPRYFEDALQMALDHDLAITGSSDLHEPLNVELAANHSTHRTATLVLTKAVDAASIREALFQQSTLAIFNGTLIGREAEVAALLGGALSMKIVPNPDAEFSRRLPLTAVIRITNDAPIEVLLQNVGPESFLTSGGVLRVPGQSSIDVIVKTLPATAESATLRFEVLSAFIAPRKHPTVQLIARRGSGP